MGTKINLGQKVTIHQFHPVASPADAVTNHMFFVQRALADIGINGDIFSYEVRHPLENLVKKLPKIDIWNCDLLLVHHSQGCPELEELLRVEVPKALLYHNITPEKFFPHDPYLSELSKLGRKQLKLFKRRVGHSFAYSEYSLAELRSNGFRSPKLFPLIDLAATQTPIKQNIRKDKAKQNLLFVGRLMPHKNQAQLIQILYWMRRLRPNRKYTLTLVGGGDLLYTRYIELLVRALELKDGIRLTGKLPQTELQSAYKKADAFVSASLHEGFGIPLLEAMRFDIPVFALSHAAIPETLGKGGVKVFTSDSRQCAQIIMRVLDDSLLVNNILREQKRMLSEMTSQQCAARVQQGCLDLLSTLRLHSIPKTQHAHTHKKVPEIETQRI